MEDEKCPVVEALKEVVEYLKKQSFYDSMDKKELSFVITNIMARYRTK